ncbi:tetratricopeptide repeat protein [Lactobacillus jensenii]|uniref:tetratricopeptide repeat protein n=1 Tax=Lactobacillus jensenii TaxID=109790 RepID=UPI001F09536F|nr:tetratricopeptide repeat protein [Lactobacillus jensenii]
MSYSEQLLDAIEKHDFSQNNILLKKALDSDSSELLAALAENLTDMGFSDMAKDVYRALIAKNPEEDLFKVYLAEILLNDGQDDDALSLLYSIDENSDSYLESLLVQADYYQLLGLLETAQAKLQEAHELAPKEDAIIFGLAELAYSTGKNELALHYYQDLATRQKHFGEINLRERIFASLAKLGRYEEASEIIKQYGQDFIDIDTRYEAGLVLLSTKDYKKAIEYLTGVLEQANDYVNAYPLLAQAYEANGDNEKALETAQTGLTYNEYDETLYALIGRVAANSTKYELAVDMLKKGLTFAPENMDLRVQLSNLYLYLKKDEENLHLFQEIDDENLEPQARWNIAVSLYHLEKYQESRKEFLLAYPNLQNNAEFLKDMIRLFNIDGERGVLKDLLQKYLKLIPDDEEMLDLYDELV